MSPSALPQTSKPPFAILCYPRTGSYLLVDLLNQSPEVSCFGEIFKKNFVELPEQARDRVGYDMARRNEDPFGYISKVISLDTAKATGFKMFPGHNQEVFSWCLVSTDIRRIALWRNPIDVYISLERAKASGEWINRGEAGNASARPKLTFTPDKFKGSLRHIKKHNERLFMLAKNKPETTMLIDYGSVTNPDSVMQVFDFLGVARPDQLNYRLKRQTVEKYSDLYTNFEEFQEYVRTHHPEDQMDPTKL